MYQLQEPDFKETRIIINRTLCHYVRLTLELRDA